MTQSTLSAPTALQPLNGITPISHLGVIRAVGRVDSGTTQTDTLDLERQRGITIRAAVAAFTLDDLHVNLIDTPGHADFIAEVERSLHALDAVAVTLPAARIFFVCLEEK